MSDPEKMRARSAFRLTVDDGATASFAPGTTVPASHPTVLAHPELFDPVAGKDALVATRGWITATGPFSLEVPKGTTFAANDPIVLSAPAYFERWTDWRAEADTQLIAAVIEGVERGLRAASDPNRLIPALAAAPTEVNAMLQLPPGLEAALGVIAEQAATPDPAQMISFARNRDGTIKSAKLGAAA